MSNKVLIIEPHGDDAFISCMSLLCNPELSIHVVTCSERSSERLNLHFPNVTTSFIDSEDINVYRKEKFNTYEVHRKYLQGEDTYEFMKESFESQFGEEMNSKSDSLRDRLKGCIAQFEPDFILSPLGLDHPYHYFVRRVVDSFLDTSKVIFYIEKPYYSKRYVKEFVGSHYSHLRDTHYREIVPYSEEDLEKKSNSFLDIYPTERGLLVFTRKSVLEDADEFIIPHDYKKENFFNYESITCSKS